ncbi:MAG: isopeptide-forming domain-containing fimbrial protein, partial [Sedimentitalea sp.]
MMFSPAEQLTNTAAITTYTAFEGDGMPTNDPLSSSPLNRVTDPLTDDAYVTTDQIEISKTLDSRQFDGEAPNIERGGSEVMVGEDFSFVVRVDLNEGEMDNLVISDLVTNGGLELVSAEIITIGDSSTAGTASGNISNENSLEVGDTVATVGNAWSFDFGDIVNQDDNDNTNDFIEIRVNARATDADAGSANAFMRNQASVAFTNNAGDANAFDVFIDRLDQGDVITVECFGVVDIDVDSSKTLPNTASLVFDSTPEDEGADGTPGDSDDRQYSLTDDAEVITFAPEIEKSVLSGSTSYAETTGTDLGIGETVTYELVLTVPEGGIDSVVIVDELPTGLEYVSSEVIRIGQSSTAGSFGDDNVTGTQLQVGDAGTSSTTLDAGDTDSDANITIANDREEIVFDFGTLTVLGDNDGAARDTEIVVRVTAVVHGVPEDVSGLSLTNTATLEVTDPGTGTNLQPDVTAQETVDLVQPELVMDKDGEVGGDPGDALDYVLTITNEGDGPAYDLTVSDPMTDVNLAFVAGTIVVSDSAGDALVPQPSPITAIGPDSEGFSFNLPSGFFLEAGDFITVAFQAEIDVNAPDAASFVNTASVDYDSVPDDPTAIGPNGTPITLGDDDSDSDDHTIATAPRITKEVIDTSFDETTGTSLSVGEIVTYQYVITLPEIALDSVVVTDLLDEGLEFVTGSVDVLNVNGTGATTMPTVLQTSSDPDSVTIDFGAMINMSDGSIGPDDEIIFTLQARVENLEALADAGATLSNDVALDVDPTNDVPFSTQIASADIDVVEPLLTIDKTGPVALDPGGDPGEFSITVTNIGDPNGAGPAYDIDISDLLPGRMTLDQGSLAFVDGTGAVIAPETPATTNVSSFLAEFALLNVGESITVTYPASLDAGQPALTSFINTATADYFSAPDDLLDENGAIVAQD